MRTHAFLGEALCAYQGAVVDLVRERTGVALEPLRVTDLADLDAVVGGPPALLFLCGLPYARCRDRGYPVEPLVAPVGVDEPGDAPAYRTLLLGRPDLAGRVVEDLDGLRLAINGRDSMSGWVLPVGDGLPLDRVAHIRVTGAHVRSMRALLAGEADVATIDSMLLAAESVHEPAFGALPVLATYGPATSPPVVLVDGDPALAEALRGALAALADDEDGRRALERGRMVRLAPVDDAAYDVVRRFDEVASACER